MPDGHVTAFFLFDVGDAIDLRRVQQQIDASVAGRLATKPPAPTYLQYQQPPLTVDGSAIGVADVDRFRVRFKASPVTRRARQPMLSWHRAARSSRSCCVASASR